MRALIHVAVFSLLFPAPPAFAKPYVRPSAEAQKELRARVEDFIRASGKNRTPGSEGAERAYQWIVAQARKIPGWELEEYAFEPDIAFAEQGYKEALARVSNARHDSAMYRQAQRVYDVSTEFARSLKGKRGHNLVLRKKGSDPKLAGRVFVVSARYDTLVKKARPFELLPDASAPGADDNAAAVVTLLSVAEQLAGLKPRRTVELLFDDMGSAYHLGTHAHAERLVKAGKQLEALNVEDIGYDDPLKNSFRIYARQAGIPGGDQDVLLASQLMGPLVQALSKDGAVVRNNNEYTDQWGFWKSFQVAVTLSQNWQYNFNILHYRLPNDTPDTLDWEFVARMRDGLVGAVRDYAIR